MSYTTQDKLRRLAIRSLKILARHVDKGPEVTSYELSLGVSAPAYITALDAAQKAGSRRGQSIVTRDAALREAGERLRAWLPQLRRDVEGVARQGFGNAQKPVEDVLGDWTTIKSLVDLHIEKAGEPLPYLEDMTTAIEAALAKVDTASDASGESRQEVVELQAQAREAAAAFSKDLVAFRATLRIVLGTKSPDYRALRVPAAATRIEDLDDDPETDASSSVSLPIADGGMADEAIEVDDEAEEEAANESEVAAAS